MATDSTVRDRSPGFEYSVFYGCDTDDEGRVVRGTADRIVSGWRWTESQAIEAAQDELGA